MTRARNYPLQVLFKGTDKVSKVLAGIEANSRRFRRVVAANTTLPLRRLSRSLQMISEQSGLNALARRTKWLGRSLVNAGRSSLTLLRSMRSLALIAGTGVGGAAAAMFALTKRSAAVGDEIGKASLRLGIGVEKLQAWRFAAESSGVATATFDMAMQRAGRRTAEAAGGFGEARDALAALGIQLRDTATGEIRSIEDLFPEIADKLSQITSASARNAVAMKLFDSEGVKLVQMLTRGSAGLKDYEERARSLGLIMSKEQVEASEKYTESLGNVRFAFRGLRDVIAGEALPFMQRFIDRLQVLVVQYRPQIKAFAAEFMAKLPSRLTAARAALSAFWERLKPLRDALKGLIDRYGETDVALGLLGAGVLTFIGGPAVALVVSLLAVTGHVFKLAGSLKRPLVLAFGLAKKGALSLWTVFKNATPLGRALTLVGLLAAAAKAMGVTWGDVKDAVVSAFSGMWDAARAFFSWIATPFKWLAKQVSSIAGAVDRSGSGLAVPGGAARPTFAGRAQNTLAAAGPTDGQQRAKVVVEFANVPRGVEVRPDPGATADLDLDLGYAMGGMI